MNAARTMIMAAALAVALSAVAARAADDYRQIDGVGRGFANLFVGWLEIPQCMTFYTIEWPGIGILPGTIQGAGMTVIRTVGGLLDLITCGFLEPGSTVYDAMEEPLYPWEGPWVPTAETSSP